MGEVEGGAAVEGAEALLGGAYVLLQKGKRNFALLLAE